MFDAKQFCMDYNINIPDRIKNTQEGWVNIKCPFPECDDTTNHGGFNLENAYYYCWKCGWHPLYEVIQELIGVSKNEAYSLICEYDVINKISTKKKRHASKIKFPPETILMKKSHKKYLRNRNFDAEYLEKEWNLMGTDSVGEYSHRIIIPILYKNKIVSYQARDITGKAELKYKACKKENEIMQHKHICYGIDKIKDGVAIIVEGVTDVWRIGAGAIAMFGTSFTMQQVNFLVKNLSRVHILFDFGEKQAQEKAKKLGTLLCPFMDVEILQIQGMLGDPCENLSQSNINYLKKIIF